MNKMAGEALGAALISAAAGVGTNLANLGNTAHARLENFNYNELAAGNALKRQKEMQEYLQKLQYRQYYDLESPAAIIKQLKDAGLSPSIYAQNAAGGNISGVSTAGAAPQGAGVSGLAAPMMQNPLDLSGTYLQMAQAEKAHEEANALRGENATGEANIKKILADIGLTQSAEELNKTQNAIKGIELAIAQNTQEDAETAIKSNAKIAEYTSWKAFWEAARSKQTFIFEKETFDERVEQIKEDVKNTIADTAMKLSQKKLNNEERAKVIAMTESIYNELFYYGDTTFDTAQSYQRWLDRQTESLPEKLALMGKELDIKKTQMWINAGTEILHTAGNVVGLTLFAKGSKPTSLWKEPTLQTSVPKGQSFYDELMKNAYY